MMSLEIFQLQFGIYLSFEVHVDKTPGMTYKLYLHLSALFSCGVGLYRQIHRNAPAARQRKVATVVLKNPRQTPEVRPSFWQKLGSRLRSPISELRWS